MIYIISTETIFNELQQTHNRLVRVIIGQGTEARLWAVGGLPVDGDLQTILGGRFAELWAAAQVGEAVDFWAWALARLNDWRGRQRAALGLTSAEFQELVYTGKVLECQRWQTAPESAFGLTGEAAARGISNEAMVSLVLAQWAAWQAGSDGIEAAYITARATIEAAQSVEEIAAILRG